MTKAAAEDITEQHCSKLLFVEFTPVVDDSKALLHSFSTFTVNYTAFEVAPTTLATHT